MSTAILSLILAAASVPFELTTLNEQTVRGELVAITDDAVTLKTEAGEKQFALEELLSLSPQETASSEASGDVLVEFADGSLIRAAAYSAKSGRATITVPEEEPLTPSARSIRSVRLLKQSEHEKELWNEIIDSDPKGDAVVVRKGGDGKPVTYDFLLGAIRDVSDTTVQFDFEGDLIPVNRNKVQVAGLIYYQRAMAKPPKVACRIDTVGGDRWMASSVSLEGEEITFRSAGGIERTMMVADISQFDFSLGKIAFLSDLQPVKETWQPYLGAASVSESTRRLFAVRRNQTFRGEPIRLNEQEFRKGLAIHSRTEVSYRLPAEFGRLQAVIGIDPSQKNHGNVRLEIRGDNRVLLDETIAGDQPPKQIELDISDVGRLTILVDFGEGWDIGDQLLLGGARVIR